MITDSWWRTVAGWSGADPLVKKASSLSGSGEDMPEEKEKESKEGWELQESFGLNLQKSSSQNASSRLELVGEPRTTFSSLSSSSSPAQADTRTRPWPA